VLPGRKIQNALPFHEFRQKLANSDAAMEALNGTALFIAGDSIADTISFIRRIVL